MFSDNLRNKMGWYLYSSLPRVEKVQPLVSTMPIPCCLKSAREPRVETFELQNPTLPLAVDRGVDKGDVRLVDIQSQVTSLVLRTVRVSTLKGARLIKVGIKNSTIIP